MSQIFLVGVALGCAIVLARFKVPTLVPLCLLFGLVALATQSAAPIVAMFGMEMGYMLGIFVWALVINK